MQEQGEAEDLDAPVLVLPPLRPLTVPHPTPLVTPSQGAAIPSINSNAALPDLDLQGDEDEDDGEAAERDMESSERDVESELLEQLQELHRQLAEVRQQSKREERERRLFQESSKLIVCVNKKPVRLTKSRDGAWVYDEYKARIRSAIDSLAGTNKVRWVSWPGSHVDLGSQECVRKKLEADYATTPVFLNPDIAHLFYHKFCHGVLWPLFHCINSDNFNEGLLESFMEQYEAYHHANQCYLEVVADIYEPGDLVLVLDYELMALPLLLRKRFPDVVCGFFLHCPFPSSEFYRMLPVRTQLLQGMLGADLVSFNHFDYVRHFLNACTRLLGLECFPSRVEVNGRLVSLSICPAGIQPEDYEITTDVQKHIEVLSSRYGAYKMIVSMDRLDPCKGIPQKLMAVESLLENYPEWRGKVVFFAIIRDRNRPEDRELSRVVDGLVGRVNGRFGYCDYTPINYVKTALMWEEVVALNALADVKLVTSIREGINLGAMEFIACQQATRHGVLVYSEFAGCSTDFKGALIVNPYDADKVAETIHVALTMSSTAKQIRNHQLSRYVNTYTSALWARRLVSSLQQAGQKAREYNQLQRVELSYFQAFYERSRKRLLIFDYDGTLVPYHSLPQLAAPSAEVVGSLEALCEDPSNLVFVISGRKKDDLHEWLGHIPRLGLLAENGYWCRLPSELLMGPSATSGVGPASTLPQASAIDDDLLAQFSSNNSTRSQGSTAKASPTVAPAPNGPLQPPLPHDALTGAEQDDDDEACRQQQQLGSSPSSWQHSLGNAEGASLLSLLMNEQLHMGGSATDWTTSSGLPRTTGQHDSNTDLIGAMWEGWLQKKLHVDLSWKDEVIGILESFTERTPGSFLEMKDSCLSWHYRDADPDFGMTQAKNLHQHLDQMLKHQPVRVITCPTKKYIVIHPSRLNKGRALLHVLREYGGNGPAAEVVGLGEGGMEQEALDVDFVLVVGDERTDEDMFDVLQGSTGFAVRGRTSSRHVSKFVPSTPRGHCFTVTVGRKMSRAQYYVDDPKDVQRLLVVLAGSTRAAAAAAREREPRSPPMSSANVPLLGNSLMLQPE